MAMHTADFAPIFCEHTLQNKNTIPFVVPTIVSLRDSLYYTICRPIAMLRGH